MHGPEEMVQQKLTWVVGLALTCHYRVVNSLLNCHRNLAPTHFLFVETLKAGSLLCQTLCKAVGNKCYHRRKDRLQSAVYTGCLHRHVNILPLPKGQKSASLPGGSLHQHGREVRTAAKKASSGTPLKMGVGYEGLE